jgi:hypothetical protein
MKPSGALNEFMAFWIGVMIGSVIGWIATMALLVSNAS